MKLRTLCAAAAALAMLVSMPSCKKDKLTDKIDLIPVKLSEDGNWSMMNKDGKIVYEDEFKNEPSVCYNGFFSVGEGEGYTIYKLDGDKPKALEGCEGLKEVGYMEDGLIPVTRKNERISVLDKNGKEKFKLDPVKNQEVVRCSAGYHDGMLMIGLEDGKVGFVDKSGKAAIAPTYDVAADFNEGVALVGTYTDSIKIDENLKVDVIDKSGKKMFSLKESYKPVTGQFNDGRLLVKDDDVYFFLDKKGEKTKLSSKLNAIKDYNEDYIIYSNEEGDCGIADIKGEILVRAKYENLVFAADGQFLAKKSGDDEYQMIDSNGEVKEKLDYKSVSYFEGFGYIVKDGSTYLLLDEKFKEKSEEDFYDIGYGLSFSFMVETDYFDVNNVAKTIVGIIGSNGVGKYTLGSVAATVVGSSAEPSNFTYTSQYDFDDLDKSGFRYYVDVKGQFTENMARYDYDYYAYTTNYYWNSNSRLSAITINLSSESEWGENGFNAIQSALKAADFKLVKSGVEYSNFMALYQKGETDVLVTAPNKGDKCEIIVFSTTILPQAEYELKNRIDSNAKVLDPDIVTPEAAPTIDFSEPVAVDSVADVAVAEVAIAPAK